MILPLQGWNSLKGMALIFGGGFVGVNTWDEFTKKFHGR